MATFAIIGRGPMFASPLAAGPLPFTVRATPRLVTWTPAAGPRSVWAALLVGVVLAFSGCPKDGGETTLPVLTTDDAEAERAMRDARESMEEGRHQEAEERFRAFLRDHPSDPLVPIARLGLGRMLLARGESAAALEEFEKAAQSDDTHVAESADLYAGVALQLEGESERALERLRPLVGRTVAPADTALALRTVAAAHERLGDRSAAIEVLDQLVGASVPAADRDEARSHLEGLVRELQAEEVQALFDRLDRDGYAWPLVGRRALREAFAAAAMDRVRVVAAALRDHRVPLEGDLRSMALRAERTTDVDLGAVGAILPLSGRGQEVGRHALEGMMLAAGLPAEGPAGEHTPRIFFRDSGMDAAQAARAVDDLVTLHQVVAIVGPVTGDAARAAARRAQELGVPLLTLSVDEDVTSVGPLVFRLLSTADEEARELVTAAVQRGATSVAVAAPEHGYGRAMAAAAERHASAAGVTYAGHAIVDASDLQATAQRVREVQADAWLLADHPRALATLVPTLAAAGLASSADGRVPRGARAVRFLIPGASFDPGLVRSAQRYLQGSLFARAFVPETGETARVFAESYRARYNATPDLYAAAGYDAFRMLRAITHPRGDAPARGTTRGDVAAQLPRVGVPRVSLSSRVSAERTPQRSAIFELRGDTFVRDAAAVGPGS